LIKIKF